MEYLEGSFSPYSSSCWCDSGKHGNRNAGRRGSHRLEKEDVGKRRRGSFSNGPVGRPRVSPHKNSSSCFFNSSQNLFEISLNIFCAWHYSFVHYWIFFAQRKRSVFENGKEGQRDAVLSLVHAHELLSYVELSFSLCLGSLRLEYLARVGSWASRSATSFALILRERRRVIFWRVSTRMLSQ